MTTVQNKAMMSSIKVPVVERGTLGGFRKTDKNAMVAVSEDHANIMDTVVENPGAQPLTKAKVPKIPLIDQLWFNVFVSSTAFANAFIIGLEQELSDSEGGISDRLMWYMVELIFAGTFTVEILMRMSAQRLRFLLDIWNVCDTVIVSLAVVDALLLQPMKNGGKLRLLTTLRVLRIVRLVRLVRMYKQFRELWLLVGGMVNSIKALAWICIILMLLIYVCAVVTTTEIGHNDLVYGNGPSYDGLVWPYKEYFGTVFKSMFSLFQVVTLDGWCDDIVRHIIYFQPILALLFLGFLVLTAFGLMNVVIGVIVENTLAGAAVADETVQKEQSAKRRKALGQLQVMLELSDTKRTGQITLQELQAAAQSRVVQQQFEALEVRQTEVEQIFELLDYERRGKVELKKFIDSCRELIGGQRRRDIAQVEITVGTLTQRLDSLDKKFSHIESEVSALGNLTEDFLQNTVRLLTGFDGSDLDMQPDWDR